MEGLVKIRDVSAKYGISARALRYYEDMNLIVNSRLEDSVYRMYDAQTIKRIEQILILRKLNISIKDIKRIFDSAGSEVVLEVLSSKADGIDEEIALLQELKDIVLDFISQIKNSDFGNDSDVKMLYEKAKEIENRIVNVSYDGNPSAVNRLLEVAEKLDGKAPGIMVIRLPRFKAVSSGLISFEELFGGDFQPWQEAHNFLFAPVIFDAPDFMYGKDGKAEWLWAIKDGVTEEDTFPYKIVENGGGLYALSVSVDGDGESHERVITKTDKWLESTNFAVDGERETMVHMMYVDEEIKQGLGYFQQNVYVPVKLKRNV